MEQTIHKQKIADTRRIIKSLVGAMKDAKGNKDKLEVLKGCVKSREMLEVMFLDAALIKRKKHQHKIALHLADKEVLKTFM